MSENNLFDHLNSIFYKKSIEFDKKQCSGYKLTLWLSHDKNLINDVNRINQILFDISDECVYNYFYHKVPKGRRFIKYTKKDKKVDNKEVEELMKQHNMSKREAELCLQTG